MNNCNMKFDQIWKLTKYKILRNSIGIQAKKVQLNQDEYLLDIRKSVPVP